MRKTPLLLCLAACTLYVLIGTGCSTIEPSLDHLPRYTRIEYTPIIGDVGGCVVSSSAFPFQDRGIDIFNGQDWPVRPYRTIGKVWCRHHFDTPEDTINKLLVDQAIEVQADGLVLTRSGIFGEFHGSEYYVYRYDDSVIAMTQEEAEKLTENAE